MRKRPRACSQQGADCQSVAEHTIMCVHNWAAVPDVVHRARGVIAWLTLYWAEPSATWSSVLGFKLS